MPKEPRGATPPAPKKLQHPQTTEATAFVHGLLEEFADQVHRYHEMTAHLLEMEAKVELAEKQLRVVRDHFAQVVQRTQGALPRDWTRLLNSVRFVGSRLADACLAVLRERKEVAHQELLDALNLGMYRFRTNTPLREIHGALLRQPQVERMDEGWRWTGPDGGQTALHLVKQGDVSKEEKKPKIDRTKERP